MNKNGPLNATDGVFIWKLPNTVPAATYFVRAYTICGTDANGDTQYCSWGQSKGFFTTTTWNSVPGWLIAVTVPLIALGPTLLALYFGVEHLRSKRKGSV
jgi:hypothetical protein